MTILSDEKLTEIIKWLVMIILFFVAIFCLLLLFDWIFGELGWDYIPGVGKDSGTGFIQDFFGIN